MYTHIHTYISIYIKYITHRHRHTYTPTYTHTSTRKVGAKSHIQKQAKKHCLLFLEDFLSEKNQVIRATLRKQVCITFCVAKCKCKCPHFSVSHTYSIVAEIKKPDLKVQKKKLTKSNINVIAKQNASIQP